MAGRGLDGVGWAGPIRGDRIERAAQAAGVLGLVLGIEPREHDAGALVDEMDEAEIPAGVADLDARRDAGSGWGSRSGGPR